MDNLINWFSSLTNSSWANLEDAWESLKGFANSSFTTSLAGAFAGAYAAQRIAERGKIRDELTKEIRATNSGLILTLTITNLAIAIKKQHVKKMKESYDEDLRRFDEHKQKIASGVLDRRSPLELTMDFRFLPTISPPIAALQDIVLGQMSTPGSALATVTALADGISNMNATIEKRNSLLTNYKAGNIPDGAPIQALYLGFSYGDGKTNREYGDSMEGLNSYTNDVIFFGTKLCEDLSRHGEKVISKNRKILKGVSSKLVEVDLQPAREMGLIPEDSEYKEWLGGVQERSEPKRPWWKFQSG